jgi:hypothetical protein
MSWRTSADGLQHVGQGSRGIQKDVALLLFPLEHQGQELAISSAVLIRLRHCGQHRSGSPEPTRSPGHQRHQALTLILNRVRTAISTAGFSRTRNADQQVCRMGLDRKTRRGKKNTLDEE